MSTPVHYTLYSHMSEVLVTPQPHEQYAEVWPQTVRRLILFSMWSSIINSSSYLNSLETHSYYRQKAMEFLVETYSIH